MKRKLPNSIDCFISEWTEFESHNDRYYDMYSLLCDLEKCGHIHFCEHGFTYDHVYEEDNTETYGSRPSFNRIESNIQPPADRCLDAHNVGQPGEPGRQSVDRHAGEIDATVDLSTRAIELGGHCQKASRHPQIDTRAAIQAQSRQRSFGKNIRYGEAHGPPPGGIAKGHLALLDFHFFKMAQGLTTVRRRRQSA